MWVNLGKNAVNPDGFTSILTTSEQKLFHKNRVRIHFTHSILGEYGLKQVEIFTDGACSGNPGPGGWGAILRYKQTEKEISGGEKLTTNNRMELLAVINALKLLKEPCEVTLYSDSQYVCNALKLGWAKKWKANSWMRNKKDPALNPELWDELLKLYDSHSVNIVWVKGHAGHPENERCDKLAVAQSQKFSQT